MSFNDIQPRRGSALVRRDSGASAGTAGGAANALSADLQQYQTLSVKLKEKVAELKRLKSVSASQKGDANALINDLNTMETRLRNQLESQTKQLDQLPRAEIAQKRIALGKLSKDLDRVKATVVLSVEEAASIKIDNSNNGGGGTSTVGGGGKKESAADTDAEGAAGSVFRMGQSQQKQNQGQGQGQQLQFQQQLQGQEVDDLIAEERERDIIKMNQDLRLVNEMFKDMAEIVEKQNPSIQKIAETTEASHEQAKAGLEQVQQAAASQGGCVMA